MSSPQPVPPFRGVQLDSSLASSSTSSTSFWDRVSTWASENKAVVYTIAGIAVVVTGAGAVYYFSDSKKDLADKRPSKKERRKAKKEALGKETVAPKEVVPEAGELIHIPMAVDSC